MRSAPSIGFEYRPSRSLTACATGVLLLALLAIALSGIPPWLAALLGALTLAYGGFALRRYLRPPVRALTWRSDGSLAIALSRRSGDAGEAEGALHAARVFGPLVVLQLRWPPRGRCALWLLPDNLEADARRRLRARLHTDGAQPASVNADSL